MARTRPAHDIELPSVAHPDQPVEAPIGLFLDPESAELTYFRSEEEAEAAISDGAIEATLNSAGMWSDFDWDDIEVALDRSRHEIPPTRPFGE
jgi:hypothetical protein